MQRSGESGGAQGRDGPALVNEGDLAVETNLVAHAKTRVEIEQRRAASHQHVLAVVDRLRQAAKPYGGGPPAQYRATLDQSDREAQIRQGARRREARQPASDDDHACDGRVSPPLR